MTRGSVAMAALAASGLMACADPAPPPAPASTVVVPSSPDASVTPAEPLAEPRKADALAHLQRGRELLRTGGASTEAALTELLASSAVEASPATATDIETALTQLETRWEQRAGHYMPTVYVGNQAPIGAAAVPFAKYLVAMHNRLHPIFADSFLLALDPLPPSDRLRDERLIATVEIVLDANGAVTTEGIVRSSGSRAFDVAVLESVDRAQPFGATPSEIRSPDGNVYIHWALHRDEKVACATMNVQPFRLKPAPSP